MSTEALSTALGIGLIAPDDGSLLLMQEGLEARGGFAARAAAAGNDQSLLAELTSGGNCRAVALALGPVHDGRALMRAVRRLDHPIVVLKVPAPGSRGDEDDDQAAFSAALRQSGALEARDLDELLDAALALAAYGSRTIAAGSVRMAGSGGPLEMAAQAAREAGLGQDGASPVQLHEAEAARTLAATAEDPTAGALIVAQAGPVPAEVAAALAQAAKRLPTVTCLSGGGELAVSLQPLALNFPTPQGAARAMAAVVEFGARRAGVSPEPQPPSDVTPMNIEGTGVMDEHETKRLLDRWGVTVVPGTLVVGPGRHEFTPIRKLATHFGFPVVLKAIRKDIVDKFGMGAVTAGIQSVDELEAAWERMHAAFPDAAWLVHPALPGGVELIVAARRDPIFGPVVKLGTGGLMTELYADVSTRVAPVTEAEALQMVNETKAGVLIGGFHGLPVYEPLEVAQVLVGVGHLMVGQPSVQELLINPLLLTEKGPVAMDAMAVIS